MAAWCAVYLADTLLRVIFTPQNYSVYRLNGLINIHRKTLCGKSFSSRFL